jgi:hypothetical protein
MPCHVMGCACSRFVGDPTVLLCPVCSREYATRTSLEIHLYGQHPGLSPRERSKLLQGALTGKSAWAAAASEGAGETPSSSTVHA